MLEKKRIGENTNLLKEIAEIDEIFVQTQPTIGFDKLNLKIHEHTYSICELGSSMFQNWKKFIPKAKAIIYMVNCQDKSQMCEAS